MLVEDILIPELEGIPGIDRTGSLLVAAVMFSGDGIQGIG